MKEEQNEEENGGLYQGSAGSLVNYIIISNPSFSDSQYNLVNTSCVNHNTCLNISNRLIRSYGYSTLSTFYVNNMSV